jgi:glycosyltransferase involved in cell wall biosynthesis
MTLGMTVWLAVSGVTGFVLPKTDAEAIAQAIRRLLKTSPAERQRMGRNARSVEKYGILEFAAAWDQVFTTRLDDMDLQRRAVSNTRATSELDG